MFFTHDDPNWEFMQMASRAQYKVKTEISILNVYSYIFKAFYTDEPI